MLIFIPYEIETLQQVRPWANWLIVATCSMVSLAALSGQMDPNVIGMLVLDGWNPISMLGHVLLHGGLGHLIGNMIFLWVFGNAICTNTSNPIYFGIFCLCALSAAIVHNLFDGGSAIGASGAINGIVGMVLAMYPLNRVYVLWVFAIRGGSFEIRAWVLIVVWLIFDVWGVVSNGAGIAYWAHIGGLIGGVAIGLTFLKMGWIQLTEYDNESLLDLVNRGEES